MPEDLVSGGQINIEWTVTNNGTESANAYWYDSVYLSTDETLDAEDLDLEQFWTGDLRPVAAGGSYTASTTVTLRGAAPGNHFLLIQTDEYDDQRETDETDNVLAVPVSVTAANLAPIELDVPETAASGSAISVSWTVENTSDLPADADWYDYFYLSIDAVFDSTDQQLAGFSGSTIAPGENYSSTQSLSLYQASPGPQYLLLVVDGDQALGETDEVDNVLAMPINIGLPNLIVSSISSPPSITSGNTVSIGWTVENTSDLPAGAGLV